MKKQQIVIWGTGDYARKFFYEKGYKYDVKYFIDNYTPKYKLKNLITYHPKDVNLKKYRIVIAIADWERVARQLEENGLSFYSDYIPYNLLDRDEIPILDILLRVKDKTRQESAISEYQCNRKIALINGNCQTSRIKQYLKQNKEFSKEYVFLDIPALYLLERSQVDLLIENRNILKEVKLFISQNISKNNVFDYRLSNTYLVHLMFKDVLYIRIPNLFFDLYFPQGGKEQDLKKDEFERNLFPYNDAIIDELASKRGFTGKGYSVDEIIQIIECENLFPTKFLEWVARYRISQLKEREMECDIKMIDYIEKYYNCKPLFYSRNHPANDVLKEESIRILKYINAEWDTEIEHEDTIPSLSLNQEFIYPSVVRGLELKFVKRWYSDTISECKYTFRDEVGKYLFCCHKNRQD